MTDQLLVIVRVGGQKLSFEVADHAVRLLEASGDVGSSVSSTGPPRDPMRIVLPTRAGDHFSITAELRRGQAT